LDRTRHEPLWMRFAECLMEGLSVRRECLMEGLSVRWRHKLLAAAGKMPKPALSGVVEIDEMYVRHCHKGMRNLAAQLGRNPRKRGYPATHRGLFRPPRVRGPAARGGSGTGRRPQEEPGFRPRRLASARAWLVRVPWLRKKPGDFLSCNNFPLPLRPAQQSPLTEPNCMG
jgi:hypothetical protein